MAVRRKKRWFLLFLAAILILWLLIGLYLSNCRLTLSCYQVTTEKVEEPIRIVQLTDLHNARFGRGNADLTALVAAQEPDLILFTGDLVTGFVEGTDAAETLLKDLAAIAPVYVSIGNHEQMYTRNYGTDLTALYESTGATVLEWTWEDLEVKGQQLRLGGASGYCLPSIYLTTGEAKMDECIFMTKFQKTERCTLLMCHMPYTWIRNDAISYWDVDLVFSGHTHGGQVVLPGIGGIYGPDMGLFPGRLEGLYPSGDSEKTLVLSRGLGNSAPVPRLNNPPQVLVLDILPA